MSSADAVETSKAGLSDADGLGVWIDIYTSTRKDKAKSLDVEFCAIQK